jgi:hypothetical protein
MKKNKLQRSSFLLTKLTFLFFAALQLIFVLSVSAKEIVRTDFNREKVWYKDYRTNEKWVDVEAVSSNSMVTANVSWGKFGTIDVANTHTASEALSVNIENPTSAKNWEVALSSGLLAATNTEPNLAKLTFSFDNSVSQLSPIVVRIESFNADRKRTGGLQKVVYPATANHFLRSAFELSDM